jgi:hypothetical protein
LTERCWTVVDVDVVGRIVDGAIDGAIVTETVTGAAVFVLVSEQALSPQATTTATRTRMVPRWSAVTGKRNFANNNFLGRFRSLPQGDHLEGMRPTIGITTLAIVAIALSACSNSVPRSAVQPTTTNRGSFTPSSTPPVQILATSTPSTVIDTVAPTTVPPLTVLQPDLTTPAIPTTLTPTINTVTPATMQPLVGQLPAVTQKPTTNATQVGASFIRAALDADEQTLRALTNLSYVDAAVTLWISESGPTGQAIIAAKPITQAAGRARVAVFVDSTDLNVAALPFTVDLLQDPTTQTWTVKDAGLHIP